MARKIGQRIKIWRWVGDDGMIGLTGTIARIRLSDGWYWIHMDEAPPAHLRVFPVADPRAHHILVDPRDVLDD